MFLQSPQQSFISEPQRKHLPKSSESLLHGAFNEEESAKYFNEALLEWRNEARDKSRHINALKVEAGNTLIIAVFVRIYSGS